MKFNPIYLNYLNLYSASTSKQTLLRLLLNTEDLSAFVVRIWAFVGEDSGFPGEDSGSRREGFELCGRIRAFVKRILGFRVTEFGLSYRGIGCRGEAFGLSWGEITAFVGRILGFREGCGLLGGGSWAFV